MLSDTIQNIWPEWQIIKVLGRGSYGTVYEVCRADGIINSKSAVKVIQIPSNPAEVASLRSEGMTEAETRTYLQDIVNDFVNEIRLMESFKGNNNIVSVEDYKVIENQEEVQWTILIRMELLTPLTEYMVHGKLPEREVVQLGIDICNALIRCEQLNVIHRDIKPENIFINVFGDFKLGDFGIAKNLANRTSALSMKGTVSYMAPEVEKGRPYDHRADIYSLGLVLYRLMNENRLPFLNDRKQMTSAEERTRATIRRLSGEKLPPPGHASEVFANAILIACAPEPDARFQNAAAMKQALMNIAGIVPLLFLRTEVPGNGYFNDPGETEILEEFYSGQDDTEIVEESYPEQEETEIFEDLYSEQEEPEMVPPDLEAEDEIEKKQKNGRNKAGKNNIYIRVLLAVGLCAIGVIAVTAINLAGRKNTALDGAGTAAAAEALEAADDQSDGSMEIEAAASLDQSAFEPAVAEESSATSEPEKTPEVTAAAFDAETAIDSTNQDSSLDQQSSTILTVTPVTDLSRAQEIYYITGNAKNIRSAADINADLVTKISDAYLPLYYFGESDYGPGKDGEQHLWYHIYTEDGTGGWIRSEFVSLLPGQIDTTVLPEIVYITGKAKNIRSESKYESDLVVKITDSYQPLHFYGETGYGIGKDKNNHLWVKIYTADGLSGWIQTEYISAEPGQQ